MDDKTEHGIWLDSYANALADITIDTSDINTKEWDEWITQYTGN